MALAALPASAAAAPPPNDNYLASTTINRQDGSMANEYADSVDTTEATTQPDMFNPDKDGLPLGGGDPEPTTCNGGSSFGKTAWWDFRPPSAGGIADQGERRLRRGRRGLHLEREHVEDHEHGAVPERRGRLGGRR